jgi:putative SOS response-associated peptidase YedK
MCGRFTLTWDEWRRVADGLSIDDEGDAAASYRPRFNIAPTDQHFIITSEFERRKAQRARWGLVNSWAKDNSRASQCINAKAESLEQRASFREAFQQHRCVVAADGWYEWTGPKSKRQPLWIHPKDGGLMLFAGLYESWYPEKERPEVTFTIVTCAANTTISEIHDRMPVILDERAAEDWMNPRERYPLTLKRLLVPAPLDLLAIQTASPLVNSVKNEGPTLLKFNDIEPTSLFGSNRG